MSRQGQQSESFRNWPKGPKNCAKKPQMSPVLCFVSGKNEVWNLASILGLHDPPRRDKPKIVWLVDCLFVLLEKEIGEEPSYDGLQNNTTSGLCFVWMGSSFDNNLHLLHLTMIWLCFVWMGSTFFICIQLQFCSVEVTAHANAPFKNKSPFAQNLSFKKCKTCEQKLLWNLNFVSFMKSCSKPCN